MTEPTRDALHAETLAWLEQAEVSAGHDASEYIEDAEIREPAIQRMLLAEYAAKCVRRVPELEAEVERLRAKAEIVDWLCANPSLHFNAAWRRWDGFSDFATILAATAAATREGTDG